MILVGVLDQEEAIHGIDFNTIGLLTGMMILVHHRHHQVAEGAALPYLFAEIMASNIGGTAMLIGDPPNIIIGSQVGLTFNDFLYHLAPIIVVILAVQTLMIHLFWGRVLRATPEAERQSWR